MSFRLRGRSKGVTEDRIERKKWKVIGDGSVVSCCNLDHDEASGECRDRESHHVSTNKARRRRRVETRAAGAGIHSVSRLISRA